MPCASARGDMFYGVARHAHSLALAKKVAATGIAAYSSLENIGLFDLLTALVSYGAGGLACGLAGGLALAAAAFLHGLLQVSGLQCFNVLHVIFTMPFLQNVKVIIPHLPFILFLFIKSWTFLLYHNMDNL